MMAALGRIGGALGKGVVAGASKAKNLYTAYRVNRKARKAAKAQQATATGGSPISPSIAVQANVKTGKERDIYTILIILFSYALWGFDKLGKPYGGFEFSKKLLLNTDWILVFTSGVVVAFLVYQILNDLFEKDSSLIIDFVILGFVYSETAAYLYELNKTYTFIGLIILIAVAIFIFFMLHRAGFQFEAVPFVAFIIMVTVYSFLWVVIDWRRNPIALFHVAFITFFCLFYLPSKREIERSRLYIITTIVLLADFFLYNLNLTYPILSKIPILVLVVTSITGKYIEGSTFAKVNWAVLVAIAVYIVMNSGTAYGQDSSGTTAEAKKSEGIKGVINDVKKVSKQWLSAFQRKVTGTVEGRIDVATGGYSGLVEKNQYESLGVYFADPRAGEPRFYPGQAVTIWATIRSKTYQDPVIIENFECYVDKDNDGTIDKRADRHKPDTKQSLPVFKLEENDVQCTFDNGLDSGQNEVTLSAEYNFATNSYIKSYFIDRETSRTMVRENLDPLTEFGIQDKQPQAVFTNGPIQIMMKVGPLVHVSKEGYITPQPLHVLIQNRQQTEDKDQRIISQWEGKVSRLKEVIILTPPKVIISTPANCQIAWDSTCPCNRPVQRYELDDCKNSCADLQSNCNRACRNSAGQEIPSCTKECARTFESCKQDCDSLFRVSPEEGDDKQRYNGYSLNVNSDQFRNEYRDIEGDKYASFYCELNPDYDVLENKQLVTKYFRLRVRYDYQLKNIVSVPVEQVAGVMRTDVDSMISQFSNKYDVDENLVKAIIIEETKRGKHCCQENGKNKAHNCKESSDRTCEADRILTSFDTSSVGIMQINIHDDPKRHGHPEWKTNAAPICGNNLDGTPKTVYDIECNIELGIKLLKEKYDDVLRGVYPKCTSYCKGQKIYAGWDAAIRAYNGCGCPTVTSECNADCSERVKTYVERVKKYKQQIDNGEIDLIVSKVSQESDQSLPRLEPLESASNPQAKDTEKADRSITISWTESPTLDIQYKIYRYKADASGSFIQEHAFTHNQIGCTSAANQLTCIDTRAVADNQKYRYKITALRGTEESEYIQTPEVTPVKDAPSGSP